MLLELVKDENYRKTIEKLNSVYGEELVDKVYLILACPTEEQLRTFFRDRYYGVYSSLGEWAKQYLDKDRNIPNYIRNYINYELYGKDKEKNKDILVVTTFDGKVYVFVYDAKECIL